MRKKLREYLAAIYRPGLEPTLTRLLAEKLISDKDAETIRKGRTDDRPVIAPTKWLYWNVHVDGLEYTHDLIVEREGVFKECVLAVRMAKLLGFQVATNTTVYKETDVAEIEQMFEFFSALEVDGHTISPGYDYDAAKKDMAKRLGKNPEDFFLTRAMTREKFAKIEEWGKRFTILGTTVYQEFLAGKRDLTCTAWAIPTRNVRGWKAPCYLMTDGHYEHYQEMLDRVDWTRYGVVNGVARDPRCENCMVHCGYDPSGALGTNYQPGDNWKNIQVTISARGPRPIYAGRQVKAFNGFSIGKGHLAEAKAAINPAWRGQIGLPQPGPGCGACGSGETSPGEALPASPPGKRRVSRARNSMSRTFSQSPRPSTASTAAPARATRRGARSPVSGIRRGWRNRPRWCRTRSCWIARRTTSTSNGASRRPKGYDHVIIHTSTPSLKNDCKVAEAIKQNRPETEIGFVGAHAAVLPAETLKASSAIDWVGRKEFDFTCKEVAEGRPLETIAGLSYRDQDGKIKHNPEREMIQNMDALPWVADVYKRDLQIEKYFIGYLLHPYVSLYTGRGCPAQCTFCLWPQTIGGHKYRVRSPQNVADEMAYMKKLFPQVREFFFDDDTFTANLPARPRDRQEAGARSA